jgi:mannose-1-phosphate guanylyltransferase
MRHALIIAGGSGTRLWPLSRQSLPKQLIPFVGGRSLLEIAYDRLDALFPAERRYICAGESHMEPMLARIPTLTKERFIGEPTGRDTLNALALSAAVIEKDDKDAVIAVFTADHIIEPVEEFARVVDQGLSIVENSEPTLMTFGITPTHAATGYGYLALGSSIEAEAQVVSEFKEKPDLDTASGYLKEGPQRYLWNSGMFLWKASVFLDCVRRYEPEVYSGIMKIVEAWGTPDGGPVISEVYPGLKRISVDFAVMERASRDPEITVAAIPMKVSWLDVGSWPAYGEIIEKDKDGNGAAGCKSAFVDSKGIIAVSDDPDHLVATIGCDNLVVIHSANATLVCPRDEAEKIKALHAKIGEEHGGDYV